MDTPSRTAAALGVDFGTHHTVATVLRADGRRHQLLFDGSPLLPSGIYLDTEAVVHVGRDAAREGRLRPERYERNPKLRLDAPSILLGDREVPVRDAVAAVLRRVVAECGTVAGPPRSVTVTVPAGWGPARRHTVADAALAAGAASPVLLPEPVAAARYFTEVLGHELAPGRALVVFDLGAGTFDASAVSRTATGHEVLAVDGSDRIGGHYLDQALVDHLGGRYIGERADRWGSLLDPDAGSETLRQRFALYDEVREAKERLSRGTVTEVVVPGFANEEMLTRSELELLARPLLARAVAITKAVIREAGLSPEQVAGVFMVGGASRMPLAATMIHQELGIAPTLIEQPELVVSEGAVAAAPPPEPPAPRLGAAPPPYIPALVAPVGAPVSGGPVTAPLLGILSSRDPAPERRSAPWLLAAVVVLALVLVSGLTWFITEYSNRADDSPGDGSAASNGPNPSSDGDEPDSDEPVAWGDVEITAIETMPTSITVHTSASGDMTGCTAVLDAGAGAGVEPGLDCAEFVVDGLWANTEYEVLLYGPGDDPADADGEPIGDTAHTPMQTGEVYWDCPTDREYCRNQGGEPGIRGEPDEAAAIAYASVGEVFDLVCYETGDLITPRGDGEPEGFWDYHPGKDASDVMVEVVLSQGEVGYLPFVWLVVDPADVNSLGGVRPC
ncbi:Hsp70 family protein [Glycomyces harbinensis]|uniref:Hsp70 protein n=1 Tax=Glycomyces harbinensis TaxID=58114 RepID=A0A1G6WFV1_9ACTN|nr:Hsp70 family protein [Glycomyces harbinensis]SDD64711.1 Hsp70 protein [Glycomyces harbinensis]